MTSSLIAIVVAKKNSTSFLILLGLGISVITQPADEEQELTVMDRISEANKRKNEE